MTDRACAICTKRHEIAAQTLGGAGIAVPLPARLECRALPPVQGAGRDAAAPTVAADHYCHVYFQADPDAIKARDAAATEAAALAEKVAATQAVAAAQPSLPLEPNQVEAEPEAEKATPKRARRARSGAAE